jgi:hypothetical protein
VSLWSVHISASGCILSCSDVSVILFAFMCNFSICQQILEEIFKNIEILDLDDNLTKEEKRQILKLHMKANNIIDNI